jgi:hypothetical protein
MESPGAFPNFWSGLTYLPEITNISKSDVAMKFYSATKKNEILSFASK